MKTLRVQTKLSLRISGTVVCLSTVAILSGACGAPNSGSRQDQASAAAAAQTATPISRKVAIPPGVSLNDLHPYGEATDALLHNAEQAQLQACMAAKGLTYQTLPPSDSGASGDSFGVMEPSVELAAVHGLRSTGDGGDSLQAAANDLQSRTTPKWSKAFDGDSPSAPGCVQEVAEQIAKSVALSARDKFRALAAQVLPMLDETSQDRPVVLAQRAMEKCMADAGISMARFAAVLESSSKTDRPSSDELTVAVARAKCDLASRVSSTMIELRKARFGSWVAEHSTEVIDLLETTRAESVQIGVWARSQGIG